MRESFIDQLKIGDVPEAFDRVPMDEFFARKRKYISASGNAAAQHMFFYQNYLFPQQFRVRLGDGREVVIDRSTLKLHRPPENAEPRWITEPAIAYIEIDSFGQKRFEDAALDAVKKFQNAKGIIFDVRGNGGGTTPDRLLDALIGRPYRDWSQSSAFSVGLFGAYRQVAQIVKPGEMTEYSRGYNDAFVDYFSLRRFCESAEIFRPRHDCRRGHLRLLRTALHL